MTDEEKLAVFARIFNDTVRQRADDAVEDDETFQENFFTDEFLKYLNQGDEIQDWEQYPFERVRQMKVNAINIPDGDDIVDLFVSHFTCKVPPETVGKELVERALNKLRRFLTKSLEGLHQELEETSPGFQAAHMLYRKKRSINRARLFFLTDAKATVSHRERETIDSISYTYHIWDIDRLFRLSSAHGGREVIEIDFLSKYGTRIPCLPVTHASEEHETCVAIFPGRILCEMYEEHGSDLLQRNVRSYLQARGKVNKGIRDTIKKNPDRFLAYNNGITATVAEMKMSRIGEGQDGWGIEKVTDFQIVNGGQTTAGIYHAHKRVDADLSRVWVQAKVSRVVPEQLDEMVPLISRYANSQNKISDSDFASNDPFHTRLQELSNTIAAPPTEATEGKLSYWYYERARGQYAEEKARRKARWAREHPSKQTFDKTEMARVLSCFELEPFNASLGPQKNFKIFSQRLDNDEESQSGFRLTADSIDKKWYQLLVARLILFREAKRIIDSQKKQMPANRTNVLCYTLSYLTEKGLCDNSDLKKVWNNQCISRKLENVIYSLSKVIYERLVKKAGSSIVAEWAKKKECWQDLKTLECNQTDSPLI